MKKLVCVLIVFVLAGLAVGGYVQVWYDGFNTSALSQDVNFEYASRQVGTAVQYVEAPNTDDSQIVVTSGDGVLSLAWAYSQQLPSRRVSPDVSFTGIMQDGSIIGTKVSVRMKVYSASGSLSFAAINFGPKLSHHYQANNISIGLVQDNTPYGEKSVEIYAGVNPYVYYGNNLFLTGQWNLVEIYFTDPNGGNPWDGGQIQVKTVINGNPIGTITTSGWTQNYVTLDAGPNFMSSGAATHLFDDLTVFATVPEPATLAILALGAACLVIKRR